MHTSIVSVHGSAVHNSTLIDSVVHAVVKGIEFLKGSHTVNAMREERSSLIDGIDYNYGVDPVYERIISEMDEANDRYNKILEVHNGK